MPWVPRRRGYSVLVTQCVRRGGFNGAKRTSTNRSVHCRRRRGHNDPPRARDAGRRARVVGVGDRDGAARGARGGLRPGGGAGRPDRDLAVGGAGDARELERLQPGRPPRPAQHLRGAAQPRSRHQRARRRAGHRLGVDRRPHPALHPARGRDLPRRLPVQRRRSPPTVSTTPGRRRTPSTSSSSWDPRSAPRSSTR